ncbi:MAG: Rap1a/Tai family immunity protein [Afipia sp.]|jgi:hypothetical protein|nr:Rap1a/Tai family immunity protein [Afipia sp.]
MRVVFVSIWVSMMLMASAVSAQQSSAAPMDVARLATLKAASSRPGESGWAKVAYQEYINGLIDGLIDKEGDKFCLPANIKSARADIIFKELSADVEDSVKSATPKDLVAVATRKFLAQKYPCKR